MPLPLLPLLLVGVAVWYFWPSGGSVDSATIGPNALQYAKSAKRPCSSFVAAYVLEKAGNVPTDATSNDAWYNTNQTAWRNLNLANDGDVNGFGNIYQAKELLGGEIAVYEAGKVPVLTSGRVHIAQRWYMNGGKLEGHNVIVQDTGDQANVRLIDSNTTRGYLDRMVGRNSWRGTNDRVAVLTLPA